MPYYWWGRDTQRASLCAAGTVSAALLGKYLVHSDRGLQHFLDSLRGPPVLPKCLYAYAAMDALVSAPFGYASYVVWFRGGGLDYTDTTIALGLFGANIITGLALVHTFKSRNVKNIACHTGILAALALATAGAFAYIDKNSGLLAIPYCAWTGFCAYVAYSFYKNELNKPK